MTMTARSLEELLSRYGIRAGSAEALGLIGYRDLLEKWNRRMNLTASTAWPDLAPLFEEGIWAAQRYPGAALDHLDLGSGAGFPALPLRIMRPSMRLRLVESRGRRCAFLETVAATLRLAGVEVIQGRIEQYLDSGDAGGIDLVSWKGVKLSRQALEGLCRIARPSARFWMFHGPELPLDDPRAARGLLKAVESVPFPGRNGWQLSVFACRSR
jgi:16S rRNA (guanine527-N7)-methyltransferase